MAGPRNLSELKAAVKDFLGEESFDDGVLNTLVALADADLRRQLRILPMEKAAALTLDAETVVVPSRFMSVRRFTIDHGGTRSRLTPLPTETMAEFADLTGGRPAYFAIEGREDAAQVFRLYPIPDQAYSASLLFDADPALLEDGDFNDLLLTQPDLYLYGALVHAEAYVKNPERSAIWGALYGQALAGAKTADLRDRFAGGPLAPISAYREGC